MHSATWLLSSLFALTATASPINTRLIERGSESTYGDGGDTFNIEIQNNCPSTKEFGLYQITGGFSMLSKSKTVSIDQNATETITAPYKDLGLRLSGHAEWGLGGQWKTQALAEFGYSSYGDLEGTAYNLSLMEGCEADVGVAIYPQSNNDDCPNKKCYPGDCSPDQGWTSPDQTSSGSPADTVCYHGKTDFKVVFCP